MTDTNAVRDGAEIFTFPAEHIMRRPPGYSGDQVVLIHQGQTDTWPSIEAFRLDLLRDNQDNIDSHIESRVQARIDKAVAEALTAERRLLDSVHRFTLQRQRAVMVGLAIGFVVFAGLIR